MSWTALIPFRAGNNSKTRLRTLLDDDARQMLAFAMAGHVRDVLACCAAIDRIVVLANSPFDCPSTEWMEDKGRGLNQELSAFRKRFGREPLLIIHADLPLLNHREVTKLLDAASSHGAAMATDRVGEGTNALALADGRTFQFHFGPGSRLLHCVQDAGMPVLQDTGLAADLDTPADFAFFAKRRTLHAFTFIPTGRPNASSPYFEAEQGGGIR